MNATLVALAVFALMLAGAAMGTLLRKVLPSHHLAEDSKDMVKVGIAFLCTLAALVLGLLLATAKESFDTKTEEVRSGAAKLILLDHSLREYGRDADPLRAYLRDLIEKGVGLTWIEEPGRVLPAASAERTRVEEFQVRLLALAPANDAQRLLRERAVVLSNDFANTRWLLIEQSQSSIPMPFLAVLMFWLFTISASISLFAPRNSTLLALHVLCSASVAGALFLILEMDQPFDGLIKIPESSMRMVLERIGR